MNWGIHDRRGWMAVVLLLCACPFSAQNTGQITLELRNKPLPAVLKLIEKAGEKHIIFSWDTGSLLSTSMAVRYVIRGNWNVCVPMIFYRRK